MRKVCEPISAASASDDEALFKAMQEGLSIYYNRTKDLKCNDITQQQAHDYAGVTEHDDPYSELILLPMPSFSLSSRIFLHRPFELVVDGARVLCRYCFL